MVKINLNKVAKLVSEEEGKLEEVNIAQIKEVLRVYNTILAERYEASEVLQMLERYY